MMQSNMEMMRAYGMWIIWGLVAVAAAILLIVLFAGGEAPGEPGPAPTLPISGAGGPREPGAATITVTGKLGPVVLTDFINNGLTAADPQNSGTYYLAGSPCDPSDTYDWCPRGAPATEFNISYETRSQFFTISLLKEPLGEGRTKAERFLVNALGVSQDTLCTLNYYVGTTSYVSEQFTGKNLGFSFCPGATVLPE